MTELQFKSSPGAGGDCGIVVTDVFVVGMIVLLLALVVTIVVLVVVVSNDDSYGGFGGGPLCLNAGALQELSLWKMMLADIYSCPSIVFL